MWEEESEVGQEEVMINEQGDPDRDVGELMPRTPTRSLSPSPAGGMRRGKKGGSKMKTFNKRRILGDTPEVPASTTQELNANWGEDPLEEGADRGWGGKYRRMRRQG